MKETARLMMNLIGAEIKPQKSYAFPNALNEDSLKALYALSSKHDLCHIVAAALEKRGLLPKESEIGKAFGKQKLLAIYRREQINGEEAKICRLLEESGIDHLPLKGAVIRALYPEEWMRTSCDIDILVKETCLEEAIKVITEKLSYSDLGRDFHDHRLRSRNGVHLELHFSVAENDERLDRVLNRVWDNAFPVDGSCRFALNNEFLMFHSTAHAQFHFLSGGCGVRQLMDLWIMEDSLDYSKEKLDSLLAESGSERFFRGLNDLIAVWFEGADHSSLTLRLERYILTGGAFGTKSNLASARQTKKGGKAKYVLSRIFMPKKDLKVKYPRLAKYPVLLPYYQVRRWFGLLGKKGIANAKDEFSAKNNTETELMLKALGL